VTKNHFDLAYLTVDSVSEGVGSSQITPILNRISQTGLRVKLISFEKTKPILSLQESIRAQGIDWTFFDFAKYGRIGGFQRVLKLARNVPPASIIHGRSELATMAGVLSQKAPVLWDVRSLWNEQRSFLAQSRLEKKFYKKLKFIEDLCSFKSAGLSTLSHAVVPVLEARHRTLPIERIVVATNVDLNRFSLSNRYPRVVKALYSGTYNGYYDLKLSRDFLNELQKLMSIEVHWARPEESKFNSLGAGEDRVFTSRQQEMARIIPEYSFGLSVCKVHSGPSLSAAMPTKVAEFLATGRPIVINEGLGDLPSIVREFDVGVVLDGSLETLMHGAEKMRELLSDNSTPFRCRAAAEKYFDLEDGAKKYLKIYAALGK
jgi:glycosyltransferase involved in cell wall biosynthesis